MPVGMHVYALFAYRKDIQYPHKQYTYNNKGDVSCPTFEFIYILF